MKHRNCTRHIGNIGVDAGLVWIGDPCYVLPSDRDEPVGKDWQQFCEQLKGKQYHSFDYRAGHEGVGIACNTGYGDGVYPVYAQFNDDGRVSSVQITFIEGDE